MIPKIFVVLILVVFIQSHPGDLYGRNSVDNYLTIDEDIYNVDLNDTDYRISDSDVKIYFKTKATIDHPVEVDLSNSADVTKKGFSANKDTFFITHGWTNQFNSDICEKVSKAILSAHDVNVFIVDWHPIASQLYPIAVAAIPNVGKMVAKRIKNLMSHNSLDLGKTALVGHSLGAHISGVIGSTLGGKVDHIVGLDPAGPGFGVVMISSRLSKSDAKFVQVIHTNGGLYGYGESLGHVDYYPNGGSTQPGCAKELIGGVCSHGRSYLYFAESISSGGFVARQCTSYKDYQNGKCNSHQSSLMGGYKPDTHANGNYYLETNKNSPYAKH